jgi:hypothetical protein
MATKKRTTVKTAPRKAAKKSSGKITLPACGTYTVPRGHVSLCVPPYWTLRQSIDDIRVDAEDGETTVVLSSYQRNSDAVKLDAREYLKHFLQTAPVEGRVAAANNTARLASARFRDAEGGYWQVRFVSNSKTLVLATSHSNQPPASRDGRTATLVMESIQLKARA